MDVVICINNAFADVKLCLDATLLRFPKMRPLILGNDESNDETSRWRREFTDIVDVPVQLIHNPEQTANTPAHQRSSRTFNRKKPPRGLPSAQQTSYHDEPCFSP